MVEGFNQYDESFSKGVDPSLIPHSKEFWGPSYFFADIKDYDKAQESSNLAARKDGKIVNFFLYEALKNARYAVPFLKNMEFLMPLEKPEERKKRIAGRATTQGKSAKVNEDDGTPPIDMIEKPFLKPEHPYVMDIGDDQKKLAEVEKFIEKDRKLTVEEVKAETELLSFDKDPEYPEGMTFVNPEKLNRHLGLEKEEEDIA